MMLAAYAVVAILGVASPPANKPSDAPPLELVGSVTRTEVEKKIDGWKPARDNAAPDIETAKKLVKVASGATVEIYFGTWCGDSRRELPRFWKALELTGATPSFGVQLIAMPRDKAHRRYPDGVKITQLPTFIVKRGGKEVGRVVETAPNGIESDLLALLAGDKKGILSTRTDLQ